MVIAVVLNWASPKSKDWSWRTSIAAQVVQFALRRHGLAAAEPRTRKGALGLLIFPKRGRARSWHGSLYRQRLGSGVPVIIIWASTEGITSVAREIVTIARKSCTFGYQSQKVRFGSLAGIRADMRDVRFIPISGHAHRRHQSLLVPTADQISATASAPRMFI